MFDHSGEGSIATSEVPQIFEVRGTVKSMHARIDHCEISPTLSPPVHTDYATVCLMSEVPLV